MSQLLRPVAPPVRARLRPWSAPAGRLFVAYWGSLVLVDLTRGLPDAVAVAALLLLAVGCSLRQRTAAALAVAVLVWCFLVGFVTHAYGALTPTRPRDVLALAVLVLVAALAARTPRHGAR